MGQKPCKWNAAKSAKIRLTYGRRMQSPPELDALLSAAVDTLAVSVPAVQAEPVRRPVHPMIALAQLRIDQTLQAIADQKANDPYGKSDLRGGSPPPAGDAPAG